MNNDARVPVGTNVPKLEDPFHAPKLAGYCFTPEEAYLARESGRLLSLRIETNLACNLECKYCSHKRDAQVMEIDYNMICFYIEEASNLGAHSIVVIGGGEPTLYSKFRELITHIKGLGLTPVIFTNLTLMDHKLAEFLFENNASVIGKLDSLLPEKTDALTGAKGAFCKIIRGLNALVEVGYTKVADPMKLRLGLSFVISKENVDELPSIWIFCRNQNIFPNLEMFVPDRNSAHLSNLQLNSSEWKAAKLRILELDNDIYGYNWPPYTPLLSAGCLQFLYSLYITIDGTIWPCAGVQVNLVTLTGQKLAEVLSNPRIKEIREVEKHLQGNCGRCNHHNVCIGCRGMAYTSVKDDLNEADGAIFANDPSCFLENL